MEFPQEFTNVYTYYDRHGYLNIILYNNNSKCNLLFDGMAFYNLQKLNSIPSPFKEWNNLPQVKENSFFVEAVKEADDIFYIKLLDDTIWQIYFMLDGTNTQTLSIFKKNGNGRKILPIGISVYDAALNRYSEAICSELLSIDTWHDKG